MQFCKIPFILSIFIIKRIHFHGQRKSFLSNEDKFNGKKLFKTFKILHNNYPSAIMIKLTFPLKCLILFLAVCLAVPLISPYFNSPTANISVNPYSEVLADNSYGTVTKEGPYGNATSPVKIAYIVGVHPWEQYSHVVAVNAVKNHTKSLRYCYYLYEITVPGGINSDYETGRMDGQILARNYIVPDIEKNDYQLAVDIHSNKGSEDFYSIDWFLNVPYNDSRTNQIAQKLQSKIPGISIYDPPISSSPSYVTIPLIKNGTPAIIYEAYAYDSPETRQELANELLMAIDSLDFKYPVEQFA